jgi:hypothetical protein
MLRVPDNKKRRTLGFAFFVYTGRHRLHRSVNVLGLPLLTGLPKIVLHLLM